MSIEDKIPDAMKELTRQSRIAKSITPAFWEHYKSIFYLMRHYKHMEEIQKNRLIEMTKEMELYKNQAEELKYIEGRRP